MLAVLLALAWQPAWAAPDDLRVVAVHTESTRVSMIIATPAGPSGERRPPADVSVRVGDTSVPTTVTPMASPSLSVALVIDSASDVPADVLQAVKSGTTELLLSLPTGAQSTVISTDGEPRIAAPLASERVEALSAISALRPQGTGSVAAGVILAAQSLAAAPQGPRAIIVFSNGTEQRGLRSTDVADAISRAEAVVSVIEIGGNAFWPRVVQRSGGDALTSVTSDLVPSFRRLSAEISNQYVVTFDTPRPLPIAAEVAVRTGEMESKTVVQLPRNEESVAGPAPRAQEQQSETAAVLEWAMAVGLLLAALTVVLAFLHRRRQLPLGDGPNTGPDSGTRAGLSSGTDGPEPTEAHSGSEVVAATSSSRQESSTHASLSEAVSGRREAEEDLKSRRESTVLQGRQPVSHQVLPAEPPRDMPPAGERTRNVRNVVAGVGPAVVQLPENLPSLTVVHISGNAESRYFGVRTVQTRHNLVSAIEPYDGVRLLNRDRDKSTALRVRAIGRWTIEFRTLDDVPSFHSSYTGHGDAVVRYTGNGSTVEITGNDKGEYFVVQCIHAHGVARLVRTTRPYSRTHRMNTTPRFFEVRAVGRWTITVR